MFFYFSEMPQNHYCLDAFAMSRVGVSWFSVSLRPPVVHGPDWDADVCSCSQDLSFLMAYGLPRLTSHYARHKKKHVFVRSTKP